jgi:predicted transcriptional regulator of viral defense system
VEQQGFFTTKQAKDAGFAENTHPYHVKAGNWIREHRGIYRLAQFPPADRPDLVLWALWSRNRREEVQGVFSHQTALRLHELSDVNPAKIHMTVPETFRKNSRIPAILMLHYSEVTESEIESVSGYRFTRPMRTILDVIAAGELERSTITQAVRQAFERGLITRSQIRSTPTNDTVRKLINGALRRVA